MAARLESIASAFERVFKDRDIIVRSDRGTRHIRLRRSQQYVAATVLAGMVLWGMGASIAVVIAGIRIADQASLVADMETGYARLITGIRHSVIDPLQVALSAATGERKDQEQRIAALTGAVEGAQETVADLQAENDRLRHGLILAWQQSGELQGRLLRTRLGAAALSTARTALWQQQSDLLGEVNRLEAQIAELHDNREQLVAWLREQLTSYVDGVEEGLASTGLDVDDLLDRLRTESPGGRGGPLIPAQPNEPMDEGGQAGAADLVPIVGRALDLRDLARQLPLAEPLHDGYTLTSGFGVRRDPFDGRRALHLGLDFAAPRRTRVYATAPGEVVRAGRESAYGNVVEVDHGLGFSTVYAHLDAIKVKVGQEVGYGSLVGLLGNTGRSSGPHLHYEIHRNGRPIDPLKFVRAGQQILRAEQ